MLVVIMIMTIFICQKTTPTDEQIFLSQGPASAPQRSSLVGGLSLRMHLLQAVPRLIDASNPDISSKVHSNRTLLYSMYIYDHICT